MEVPEALVGDAAYIAKKREELREFFKDAKLPKEVIDNAIENELKPLTEGPKPYIAASALGEVKTEYEVMTGQPFTDVGDHTKPLTVEEVKEMLKGNPIIAEKARQIQIMTHMEGRNINVAVPLDEINLTGYSEMREEMDAAEGDADQMNRINYKNMQSLMNSVTDYQAKCKKKEPALENVSEKRESDSDEKEFEAIEKFVSQYTDKSYETRYQETKDMLIKMADRFDDPNVPQMPVEIKHDPVLKASSAQLIKGQVKKTAFEEIKEKYAINKIMNIPLKDNPVAPDLSGNVKKKPEKHISKQDDDFDQEKVFPKSMEAKLKDTEKALRDINSVLLNATSRNENTEDQNICDSEIQLKDDSDTLQTLEPLDRELMQHNSKQKFDDKIEQTLEDALEEIYYETNGENRQNNELEFKEMKNLARNIYEGAENLSTLIKEDITNKLNSMNELLSDVNEALENSKKSNIAYQKLKDEGDQMKRDRQSGVGKVTVTELIGNQSDDDDINNTTENKTVTASDIDDIHNAIGKLNDEIKCHEDRVNKSKASYELRNKECKQFMSEVDNILLKSQEILHPTTVAAVASVNAVPNLESALESKQKEQRKNNKEKQRKELWDVEFEYKDERNEKLAEFRKQELERNKRINDLLYDIKDKMKDNKEVLKLANNLLRREENRKKVLDDNTSKIDDNEIDAKAQGDNKMVSDGNYSLEQKSKRIVSQVPPADGVIKGI